MAPKFTISFRPTPNQQVAVGPDEGEGERESEKVLKNKKLISVVIQ